MAGPRDDGTTPIDKAYFSKRKVDKKAIEELLNLSKKQTHCSTCFNKLTEFEVPNYVGQIVKCTKCKDLF